MIGAGAAAWALAGLACGAEPAQAELAEICGEFGPVRVLELAPGERLARRPLKVGERVVYAVARGSAREASEPTPGTLPTATVWSSGPCGEAPRRLSDEVDSVFTIAQWPSALLACDAAAGEVLALDPEGVAPPHAVFTGLTSCNLAWTPAGLVSLAEDPDADEEDAGLASLVLHRYPRDPYSGVAEAVPLLDAVRTRSRTGLPSSQLLRVHNDAVLAVVDGDELLRVRLDDGAVSVVQTGVEAFVADAEGRYLVWQDATPTDDRADYPAGKLFLRDRSDSTDLFLGQAALAFNAGALRYISRGAVMLELGAIRVFSLPDMGFTDLPPLGRVGAVIDEQRWLMLGKGINVVDLASGVATTLYRGSGDILRLLGDGVELLQVPSCCKRSTLRAEGALWSVPYEGEPRRLAARASRFMLVLDRHKPDGRRVSTVDIGDDWRGALQLIDPETQESLRIDDGVFAQTYTAPLVYGEEVVVYSIPRGSRRGVWIARLPPAADAP